jgi:phenylalanyl-tRNA synthetase alpha chain
MTAPEPLVLTEATAQVWRQLATQGPADTAALIAATGLDQALIALVAHEGSAGGWIAVAEQPRDELDPADVSALLTLGLPERRGAALLDAAGGLLPAAAFVDLCKQHNLAMNEVLKWGAHKGWLAREKADGGPVVRLSEAGRRAHSTPSDDEKALTQALAGTRFLDEMVDIDVNLARVWLTGRNDLGKLRPRTRRVLSLTPSGTAAWEAGPRVKRERNALTSEDLKSGAWRDITLRPYDVTLPARTEFPAKVHPVRKIIELTRRSFLELGFTEVASPNVECAFWNFDALFQPQDHPAREMQDTFYMAEPALADLPPGDVVRRVQAAHENGGETGSTGWGYRWSPERARATVLRTHTTASTIRALAANPNAPRKAFCVGWTFRNETLSYKHLPVFHQVDGIVIDEHASLATLLGILTAFYKKMGFDKVQFKPAFYPYTEPSVDVMVYMESRKKWLEMGGSGIFRPEVTEPLGCKHPVLAWGLGIERLAMIRYGFTDIRQLYQGGLSTVEGVPLCR